MIAENWLQIDGVTVKEPTSPDISHEPIWASGSGRNQKGDYVGDVVTYKWKLNITWSYISKSDAQKILNATHKPFFDVSFISPYTHQKETIKIYNSTKTLKVYTYALDKVMYESLSISMVEK